MGDDPVRRVRGGLVHRLAEDDDRAAEYLRQLRSHVADPPPDVSDSYDGLATVLEGLLDEDAGTPAGMTERVECAATEVFETLERLLEHLR